MQFGERRSLVVDGLKALAATLIVLHHLAFYGPMADHARPLAPGILDWLADDARLAVQVFLVIGGFLAARSLAAPGRRLAPLPAIRDRFLRLALPLYAVLLLAIGCNEWARGWMTHPSISATPTAGQLLAHALLVQDLLGFESLSAGLWYVSIDLQLFALLALLWWLGSAAAARVAALRAIRPADVAVLPVAALGLAALLYCNRQPGLQAWGVYFFGSYALGVLAWWAVDRPQRLPWLALIAGVTLLALWVDYRERVALALAVALLLALQSGGSNSRLPAPRWRRGRDAVHWLAGISYAVFLVHFPVCLVVNAAFSRFAPPDPGWQLAGIAVALAASIAAGALFHAWVEAPLLRRLANRRTGATAPVPASDRAVDRRWA